MTSYEIMLADSEYWAGTISAKELIEEIGHGVISRINHLETEYGKLTKAQAFIVRDVMSINEYHITRSWFSLMIAEAERHEKMITDWPFPVVRGEIPKC